MHFRGAIQITAAIRGLATRARPGYAKKEMMKTLKKNMYVRPHCSFTHDS